MAYTIPSLMQDQLDLPERYSAVFLTFVLGTNTYGFWTGAGPKTYNSILYNTGGSLIEMSSFDQNADGSVSECTLKLSASPDKGLDDDALMTFYDEDWQFGRVTIQLAYLDPDTLDPVGAILFIRGVIYEAPFRRGPGVGSYIEARVVSQGIKLSENGGRYRNNATQIALDPTDTSLVDIGALGASITKQIKWGQAG